MPTPPRHPTTVLDGTTPPKPLARPKSLSATHQPKLTVAVLDALIAKYRPEKVAALQHKATEPVLDEA